MEEGDIIVLVIGLFAIIIGFLPIILAIRSNRRWEKQFHENPWEGLEEEDDEETYEDLLNSKEWKDKRLQILKRDHYTCRYCGSKHNLQVHHLYYVKYPGGYRATPWDYPDKALITLCRNCHENWHKNHKYKVYYRDWRKSNGV